MKLWLLRHGEAEPRARSDAERALTERGRLETRASAAHLADVRSILASPLVRAQQTAALAGEILAFAGEIQTVPWATPDSDPLAAMRYLDRFEGESVLLVSHMPFIGELGGLLVHGHRRDPLSMRTGSLAELDGEAMAAGLMRLASLRHPRPV
ncbi:phosphohistidine phosphatase SixA [Stutzerimonas tarimensis]|uniref:Phosphohistidine phosphatase SixA n=1 Tax=Stutzerimonas tarimensis TaxID=1507735 RepID=A0ABV7T8N1_9GAMM